MAIRSVSTGKVGVFLIYPPTRSLTQYDAKNLRLGRLDFHDALHPYFDGNEQGLKLELEPLEKNIIKNIKLLNIVYY